jgi:hypothetical protein
LVLRFGDDLLLLITQAVITEQIENELVSLIIDDG